MTSPSKGLYRGQEFIFIGQATGAIFRGYLVEWIPKYGFWWVEWYPGCSLCKDCKAMSPGWLYEHEFTPVVNTVKENSRAWHDANCEKPPF